MMAESTLLINSLDVTFLILQNCKLKILVLIAKFYAWDCVESHLY